MRVRGDGARLEVQGKESPQAGDPNSQQRRDSQKVSYLRRSEDRQQAALQSISPYMTRVEMIQMDRMCQNL
ncbi:fibulin-2-like protein [Lates japonicus]|uniref:Fibulin-2-like protein n=1 Tax=Lates japonicus TaxID=270547 RepID=A0AAD3REW9_LATJO|nr:fibulin-2-like protein [Lates japonicus]